MSSFPPYLRLMNKDNVRVAKIIRVSVMFVEFMVMAATRSVGALRVYKPCLRASGVRMGMRLKMQDMQIM